MPRPKKAGAPEPKRRSRNGCWPCKARKVKCGEEHPSCLNCQKIGETCDYSIRLNWNGRRSKKPGFEFLQSPTPTDSPTPLATPASTWAEPVILSPPANQGTPAEAPARQPSHSVDTPTPSPRQDSPLSDRPPKRARLGSDLASSRPEPAAPSAATTPLSASLCSGTSPAATGPQRSSSSAKSEGSPAHASQPANSPQRSPDFRRLSVNSLLSGPHESPSSQEESLREATGSYLRLDSRSDLLRATRYYGVDCGFRDLDLGSNDDANAISGSSPRTSRSTSLADGDDDEPGSPAEFGFGLQSTCLEGEAGGYYDKPVVILIPRSMEPLPAKLKENPMNVLYFHHFLNHTARVLVPHDDPQSNPFRTILPLMAVKNDNLMSLLLAYSASHRARLLQQAEPAVRIALWVQDIFPALRHALDDPTAKISNANVATAIMLASLEIISPTAFGYSIPWQKHLILARELITARPEGLRVDGGSQQSSQEEGQVCSFLWSWFAYLDVLGGLSGGPRDASPIWILDHKVYDPVDDDEIDCIMGFTTRCIYILAQVAELARHCDALRIEGSAVRPGWEPDAAMDERARRLEADVRDSMAQPPRACAHIHRSGDLARWDRAEMSATNEAYHWAALVQLHRRVLGQPSSHPDVRAAVARIMVCLSRVRRRGTAEACLLLPMFTAGCEIADPADRDGILERMRTVETTGMTQVNRARRLMQKVWEVGQPWEALLSTEFIG